MEASNFDGPEAGEDVTCLKLELARLRQELEKKNLALEELGLTVTTLRASEIRFRTLIQNSSDLLHIIDKEGLISYDSPSSSRLLGYSPGSMIGRSPLDFVHPLDRELVLRELAEVFGRSNSGKPTEFRVRRADGGYVDVEAVGANLFGAEGVDGIVVSTRLITDRKATRESLRKQAGELAAIHRAGQRLRYLQTPALLAREIIEVLADVVEFDYGAVLLIEEGTGRLVPYALSIPGHAPRFVEGDRELIASYGMGPGRGISGWVAQHCQSVCLGDVRLDPRYVAPVTYFRSELCVPLSVGDTVLGVVNVESTEIDAYGASDQRVLETIAAHIGIAIQNARLYEKAWRELTERKRAEEQLRASLKEQEVLLKEVHHRVKNNLQIITSLLSLQSANLCDAETLNVFQESQNRIRSMALMHEKLYQSRDLSSIDFADYLGSLIVSIIASYAVKPGKISLKTTMDPVSLGIDTAIPCGLIINELVTNCLKYAFPGPRKGTLTVEVHASGEGLIELLIADDGVGMPPGFDLDTASTLGLQLVTNLVHQLEGQISIASSPGVSYLITFREKKHQ